MATPGTAAIQRSGEFGSGGGGVRRAVARLREPHACPCSSLSRESVVSLPGVYARVARHGFCQHTFVVSPAMTCIEGDDPMQGYLAAMLLTATTAAGLMFLLRPGEAHVVQYPLTQVPVTGRLPEGGTFAGRLTVRTLTTDEFGQLSAT